MAQAAVLNEHALFEVAGDDGRELDIVEPINSLPPLSAETSFLLKGASQDGGETILHMRYMGGTEIQTNGKNLIPSNERREIAKWEQALAELNLNGLVVARDHKGEIFEIPNLGYQVADMIAL